MWAQGLVYNQTVPTENCIKYLRWPMTENIS